ncbi:MAG: GIY-YIG nuclease family protein, partial [Pseudomonadota bacterium]
MACIQEKFSELWFHYPGARQVVDSASRIAVTPSLGNRRRSSYILYDEYGPCYVGLTSSQGLGKRLKDHLDDKLAGKWDRFSWFGFRPIGKPSQKSGILELNQPPEDLTDNTSTTIGDLEALLIRSIGPKR